MPAVTVDGSVVKVQVGEVEHPMMDNHYIQFIALETPNSAQIRYFKPSDKPVAEFVLPAGEKAIAVYEYCNLHGLWVKEILYDHLYKAYVLYYTYALINSDNI